MVSLLVAPQIAPAIKLSLTFKGPSLVLAGLPTVSTETVRAKGSRSQWECTLILGITGS